MLEHEAMESVIGEKQAEKQAEKIFAEEVKADAVEDVGNAINIDFGFLLAKTGDGSIESYIEHPLNYKKSRGIAQIIRGFTGMFGALDLALIDIALGGFEFAKESRA